MEEKKFPKNLVMMEGESTRIFDKRSDKAPTRFFFKIEETREIEKNGIKEDVKNTKRLKGTSFNAPADLMEGDIVQMIGSMRTDHYKNREGNDVYEDALYFNKITKVGHNTAVEEQENIPTDIPEGEIDFNNIPF